MNKEHPNIEVLKRLDLTNMEASAQVIAEDFVWHYFNPELPELQGDYLEMIATMENDINGRMIWPSYDLFDLD